MSNRTALLTTTAAAALVAGFLVLFIGGGARFAIGLTLKPIVEDFGWKRSDLGLAVATFQIVSAITMFLAGYLADRNGPRFVLIAGILMSALGIGFISEVTAPWQVVALYGVVFAIGNGAASVIPVGVMVTRVFPDRLGLANAVVVSGLSSGQLVVITTLTAVLVTMSWHSVYWVLGVAHLAVLPLLLWAIPKASAAQADKQRSAEGIGVLAAARTRQFWVLLGIYAICGFDDFFVSTHVVAFAQDRGIPTFLAGNLLAVMGLSALLGVLAAGALSDRYGPGLPTAMAFGARVVVFALLMVDQSPLSVTVFAIVFGATFLVTAPLTVLFVSQRFGTRHLGALSGLITMVHHIAGGAGAYTGSAIFDVSGSYNIVFPIMLLSTVLALALMLLMNKGPAQVG